MKREGISYCDRKRGIGGKGRICEDRFTKDLVRIGVVGIGKGGIGRDR